MFNLTAKLLGNCQLVKNLSPTPTCGLDRRPYEGKEMK